MEVSNTKVLSSAVAVLVAGSLVGSQVSPARAQEDNGALIGAVADDVTILENEQQAEELLEVIDQIPEEVLLEGDEATRAWAATHLRANDGVDLGGNQAYDVDIIGCTGAILWAIGSTLIPAAKILKIKRYMKELGGVRESIKILWGASFNYEKLMAMGGTVAALGAELLGIAAIRQACADK